MFGKKERSYGGVTAASVEQAMQYMCNLLKEYDEETDKQLKEIKNSDWPIEHYLREILYELRCAHRREERPKW